MTRGVAGAGSRARPADPWPLLDTYSVAENWSGTPGMPLARAMRSASSIVATAPCAQGRTSCLDYIERNAAAMLPGCRTVRPAIPEAIWADCAAVCGGIGSALRVERPTSLLDALGRAVGDDERDGPIVVLLDVPLRADSEDTASWLSLGMGELGADRTLARRVRVVVGGGARLQRATAGPLAVSQQPQVWIRDFHAEEVEGLVRTRLFPTHGHEPQIASVAEAVFSTARGDKYFTRLMIEMLARRSAGRAEWTDFARDELETLQAFFVSGVVAEPRVLGPLRGELARDPEFFDAVRAWASLRTPKGEDVPVEALDRLYDLGALAQTGPPGSFQALSLRAGVVAESLRQDAVRGEPMEASAGVYAAQAVDGRGPTIAGAAGGTHAAGEALDIYDGMVEEIVNDTAFVVMVSRETGEEIRGGVDAATLRAGGEAPAEWFVCRVTEGPGGVVVAFEPASPPPIEPGDWEAAVREVDEQLGE